MQVFVDSCPQNRLIDNHPVIGNQGRAHGIGGNDELIHIQHPHREPPHDQQYEEAYDKDGFCKDGHITSPVMHIPYNRSFVFSPTTVFSMNLPKCLFLISMSILIVRESPGAA